MRIFSTAVAAAVMAIALSSCCGRAKQDDNKMIRLNVTVTVYDQYFNEVLDGLNLLAAESQKEDGCIGYDLYRNTVCPDELIIVETWRDQAALDAHALTPHYTAILPQLKDKMETKLERFEFVK